MESPTNLSTVRLRKISVFNLAFIFSLFGLVSGFVGGFFLFFFIRMFIVVLGMATVPPMVGLLFLSFLVLPIVSGVSFWIAGLIFGFIFNLSLRASRGLKMFYEELD